ncbi:MAG: ribonuclease HII [Candidatus Pacearchaeota archaeon]
MLILGIDDAGRGPVIGPMVIAGVLIEWGQETKMKEIGIRDSKMLTSKRREFLYEKIKKNVIDYEIIKIEPFEIDGRNSVGINLNKLEAIKMSEIINKIVDRVKRYDGKEKIRVIIDCPSNNIKQWKAYLEKYIEKKEILEIKAEWKADVNHVVVGAASILAKVTRDKEIEKIKKHVGIDFGSGYPSDPITCKFLQEHFQKYKKDGIFRETWQTWKDLCNIKKQKKLDDF